MLSVRHFNQLVKAFALLEGVKYFQRREMLVKVNMATGVLVVKPVLLLTMHTINAHLI